VRSDRSARSTRRAERVDAVRAVQRVLYRSAKQEPERRFHALYHHVARSDILWRRGMTCVPTEGLSAVDGLTVEAVEEFGVDAFLDALAARLRARTYRPKPLRRVHVPKPGRPGQTRPLGIPFLDDRVVMTAAKLVLEPIFEADFLPVSFGYRPKRSAHQTKEAVRVEANRGAEWVLDADVSDASGRSITTP
jgi:Reverse transcriptase (RNA-dependent DNA polymerase)